MKEKFLAAALRMFARNGFVATSTRDICNEVGLAHSAIYNYFASKEAILIAIEEREMTQMQAGLDAVLSMSHESSPREHLVIALQYTFEVATSRSDAWRVMAEMLRSLRPRNRAVVVARRDRYEACIRQLLIEDAQARNAPTDRARLNALFIFGVAEGMSGWFSAKGETSARAIAAEATRFVLNGIED
jgi:AcrR family transcriptional regulator